jgi:hypothetical protein
MEFFMSQRESFHIRPEWYWSTDRAEAEWNNVWTRLWQMGPRVEELSEAGDAILHSLGRESLIFLRDGDGQVRGFYNVCPHRANRLLLNDDSNACLLARTATAFGVQQYGLILAVSNQRVTEIDIYLDTALAEESLFGNSILPAPTRSVMPPFDISKALN